MNFRTPYILALIIGLQPVLQGAVVGTNFSAEPLSLERIATLPAPQRPAWKSYFKKSQAQMATDQAALRAEMKKLHLQFPTTAPSGRATRGLTLNQTAEWYGGPEARRIADIVLSYQTPAGGWSKNLDFTRHLRAPGETYAPNNNSTHLATADNDAPPNTNWTYVGTFDNDATITQLRFLAKVAAVPATNYNTAYRKAFLRGVDYIFAAQYPNGGWPQVWPLEGGYHDDITYNDGAMLHILALLHEAAGGQNEFSFLSKKIGTKAEASYQRGIECLLASQIAVNGHRTVWGQQIDLLTLQPAPARNYEMPSQSSSESAEIVLFLMHLPNPDQRIVTAVHAAAAWFEKTKIKDMTYRGGFGQNRQLISTPGSGPTWSRYYEIGSDRPIFGDRDKTIHDDVKEISAERRNGYAWYRDSGRQVLEQYATWSKSHPK